MSKWQDGINKRLDDGRRRLQALQAINLADALLKERAPVLRQTKTAVLVRCAVMYPGMLVQDVQPAEHGSGWAVRIAPTSGIRKGVAR
jgi:hypothetical protein